MPAPVVGRATATRLDLLCHGERSSAAREIRRTDLLADYPRLRVYYDRALARPAWRRTLERYARTDRGEPVRSQRGEDGLGAPGCLDAGFRVCRIAHI